MGPCRLGCDCDEEATWAPQSSSRRRRPPAVLPRRDGEDRNRRLHGVSRYKVARILDACLARGIIRIEINARAAVDTERSERLRRHFKLKYALVMSGPFADTPALREALGRAAADPLAETLTEDDLLGVAWGRTLDAMAWQVQGLPPCRIVQMTGIAGAVEAS